ncbi:vWA domain-containing protein [Clostridium akagii]|uniref:vWA domain-containing protein n=1 Tax=Clostridium akagii TaxID=91623 RepID=UPI00047C7681|nr:vWA domain-containing protein [Clostridium akagii]
MMGSVKNNIKMRMRILSIFLVISVIVVMAPKYVFGDDSATTTRVVSSSEIKVGDPFTVTYNIQPTNIPAQQDNTKKDIILVMDTSGSMAQDPNSNDVNSNSTNSKISIIKRVATSFVNSFKNPTAGSPNISTNVNIGIVAFNTNANNPGTLYNVGTSTTSIDNSINALTAGGGTNIGDGLRQAYYLLSRDTTTTSKNKYIVLMTDGMATYYSYDKYDVQYNYGWYGNITGVKSPPDYQMSAGNIINRGGNGSTDPNNLSLNYANQIASQEIATSGINTDIIGFGVDASSSNQLIATSAKGTYFNAQDSNAVSTIYSGIQTQIQDTIHGTVAFTETFNKYAHIDPNAPLPAGLTLSGNDNIGYTISGSLYTTYTLSTDKTNYVAQPLNFAIAFLGNKYGTEILGANNSSTIQITTSTQTLPVEILPIKSFSIGEKNLDSTPIITSNTNWTNVPVKNITIASGSGSDSGMKPGTLQYRLVDNVKASDGTDILIKDWTTYTAPFDIDTSREGQIRIEARTKDIAGNYSQLATALAQIDTTAAQAPVITFLGSGLTPQISFSNDSSSATDNTCSGTKVNEYKINDGPWQTYILGQTIANVNAGDVVYAQSTDNAGNVSSSQQTATSANFKVPDSIIVQAGGSAHFNFNILVGTGGLQGSNGNVAITDINGNILSSSPIKLNGSLSLSSVSGYGSDGNGTQINITAPISSLGNTYYLKVSSPNVIGTRTITVHVVNMILH